MSNAMRSGLGATVASIVGIALVIGEQMSNFEAMYERRQATHGTYVTMRDV